MEKNNKTEIRFFLAHEFDKEAKYLSDMAAKGWMICGGRAPVYKFKKIEPQDLIFQLDYQDNSKNDENYKQIFFDSGWQLAHTMAISNGMWYYFCKKATGTSADVIYTDNESKLGMINRVIKIYGFVMIFPLVVILNSIRIVSAGFGGGDTERIIVSVVLLVLMILLGVVVASSMVSLLILKNKLTKSDKDKK